MHRSSNLSLIFPLSLILILVSVLCIGLAGCTPKTQAPWLGYAEADYVYVGAPAAGWITGLAVTRGTSVKPGQPLFTLDADSQTASRNEASAAIGQAEQQQAAARASLTLAEKELSRQKNLLTTGGTTRQAYDQARQARDAAAASLRQYGALASQYHAQLSGASYQLAQRQITARTAGRIEDVYFRPGEYTTAATPVIAILPPDNVYVRFFVPEKQFARIHTGQKVVISCDGCTPVTATVRFIANTYEYAPPVVFSVSGRDKLVYKIEARAPGGIRLHPGQPVDVRPL